MPNTPPLIISPGIHGEVVDRHLVNFENSPSTSFQSENVQFSSKINHFNVENTSNSSVMPSTWERMISACFGALLTSLVVTPFDVVKVRMQAGTSSTSPRQIHQCCHEVFFDEAIHTCPTHGTLSVKPTQIKGTLQGMIAIGRQEGLSSLWTGLSPTLALQVPATVFYYLGYETIRDKLLKRFSYRKNVEYYAPLIAGMTARTFAATIISPIELIRTRVQALSGKDRSVTKVIKEIAEMTTRQGYQVLWKGLTATLWRDVPFSGIYWAGYETIRRKIVQKYPQWSNPKVEGGGVIPAFIAGATSGMVAALVTTPFDVAKTLNQISGDSKDPKMLDLMQRIVQQEGWSGLMRGWTARIAKVAPACAVMIGSYELGKSWFLENKTM